MWDVRESAWPSGGLVVVQLVHGGHRVIGWVEVPHYTWHARHERAYSRRPSARAQPGVCDHDSGVTLENRQNARRIAQVVRDVYALALAGDLADLRAVHHLPHCCGPRLAVVPPLDLLDTAVRRCRSTPREARQLHISALVVTVRKDGVRNKEGTHATITPPRRAVRADRCRRAWLDTTARGRARPPARFPC